LANHCHLWKNARDGGILVSQQTPEWSKVGFINLILVCKLGIATYLR